MVLLTVRRGSILDRGGESIEVNIQSEEERKAEENISHKAHIKDISNKKKEASEQSIKDIEDSNWEEDSEVINRDDLNKTPED